MTKPLFKHTSDILMTRESFVADAVRTAILHGTFKPGEKLDQKQISDELRVSRSPVREALRTLDAEGLVTINPNRGVVVTQRSIEELEELHFIRIVLEGAAAERAAPSITAQALQQMKSLLEQAQHTDDYEELLVLNNEFHMSIYGGYPQPILMSHIQRLRNLFGPYNRLYLDQAGSKESAWADHRRMYEACIRKDAAAVRAETENHIERVFQQIVEGIREN